MPNNRKSIIYFCPAYNTPSGGIKVIIRHSELINSISLGNVDSFIYYPGNAGFNVTWFEHTASVKRDNKFRQKSDFIVIPELWAIKLGNALMKSGLKFAIFVQNGYLLFSECGDDAYIRLRAAYEAADIILSISKDTTECIKLAFPDLDHKIYEVQYSIDANIFFPGPKENLITYMPRRLPAHSRKVVSFLRLQNLGDWKITPILNASEKEVAKILRRSKIFLSFSELEGLPVPPLEAAFSGNVVIGYTGEGGKETWLNGIFTEIESGNIRKFVKTVTDKVGEFLNLNYQAEKDERYQVDLQIIKDRYSIESEKLKLRRLIDIVDKEIALGSDSGPDNFVSFKGNKWRMAEFLCSLARVLRLWAKRIPAISTFVELIYRGGNNMYSRTLDKK
jgi:glycosyltransferase involved in cell wall biosynthesis